jgi:hypothetical protein
MLGIFSRVRRQLFLNHQLRRYVLYSIGEVILIVLGILIANWLAKSEERNKQQIQEIRILNGIKESLVQDTLTLKTNIEKYTNMSRNDSLIFYHLLYKQPQNTDVANAIHYASTYNSFLILRLSYFEEAKVKGLDIITNFELRDKLKQVYEDEYATLLRIENEDIAYDYEGIMNPKFQTYIGVKPNDKNGTEVYILDYDKLLEDTQFHQEMFKYWQIKNRLRLRNYLPVRIKVIKLIEAIEEEITALEAKR